MYSCDPIVKTSYNYLFKICLVGETGVGKSNICLQFVEKRLRQAHQPTQKMQYAAKTLEIQNHRVKLQLWDSSTSYVQDPYLYDTNSNYSSSSNSRNNNNPIPVKKQLSPTLVNSAGVLIVFSITNRDSFKASERWLSEFKPRFHEFTKFVLIGNKADQTQFRCVSKNQGQGLASRFQIQYKEISSKEYSDVYMVFKEMAQQIYADVKTGKCPLNYNKFGTKTAPTVSLFELKDDVIVRKSNCC